MSYEIAKRVKNNSGRLSFLWASNNVRPRYYTWSREYETTEIADAITGFSVQFWSTSKLAKKIKELQEKYSWRESYERHGFGAEYDEEMLRKNELFNKELEEFLEGK